MTNEIIILDDKKQITPTELFTPSGIDKILADIKEKARSFVGDMTTESGRKEIASMAYKVSRTKTALDSEGKKLTEDWARQKSMVDSERKKVREELDSLRDEVRKPLDEWEFAEHKRVGERQSRLEEIENLRNNNDPLNREIQQTNPSRIGVSRPSEFYQERINKVEELRIFDWQEFSCKAESCSLEVIEYLTRFLEDAKRTEADLVELEALRKQKEARDQKDREDRIAKDAADKAKAQAEAKALEEKNRVANEQKRKDEEAKEAQEKEYEEARKREDKIQADKKAAEQAKIDAENRAKKAEEEAKESAKKALEKERESVRIKAEQEAKELAKREANIKHQGKIHSEIVDDLLSVFASITPEQAKDVVRIIAKGKIRNLKINY